MKGCHNSYLIYIKWQIVINNNLLRFRTTENQFSILRTDTFQDLNLTEGKLFMLFYVI